MKTVLGYKPHPALQKVGLPAAVVPHPLGSAMEDFRATPFNCTDSTLLPTSHSELKHKYEQSFDFSIYLSTLYL